MSDTFSDQLIKIGFSFICAHCTKLHRGLEKGVKHCGYELKGRDCGGPMARPAMAFPQYEGPLTKQTIADVCFRCGGLSENLVQVQGGKGFVGACKEHVEMVRPNSSKAMVPVDVSEGKKTA